MIKTNVIMIDMKDAIIEEVMNEIAKNITNGDLESLEVLLSNLPLEDLVAYLPEGYFDKDRKE